MMKRPRCLTQKDEVEIDYLSQLPDELICEILCQSQLTMFDAYRTRVLSRRWEKLWLLSYTTGPNLIFSNDHMELSKPLFAFVQGAKRKHWPFSLVDGKRHLLTTLLNKVLMSYHQPIVDDFVINFNLNSNFAGFIYEWISFAFGKGVKRLQLDFSPGVNFPKWETPYTFPPILPPGIHNLREVCLKHMKIRQESVDALLSACPLLEKLSLQPENTVRLKITGGSTLKLKHLSLELFPSGEWIRISAPNLISLRFKGKVCRLHLLRVPLLSEFCLADLYLKPFLQRIDPLYSYFSQLKNLKLVFFQLNRGIMSYPTSLPEFPELQQLEVEVKGVYVHSFLWLALLIKASPMLHRFSVESRIRCLDGSEDREKKGSYSESDRRRIKKATKFSHQLLKEVEMRAFKGLSCEIGLLQHLFDIGSQSLENAVIDTRTPFLNRHRDKSRMLAQSLGKGLESRVQFVVL